MQLIENAESQLHEIIASIEKDPSSWEHWLCLHLKAPQLSHGDENIYLKASISTIIELYMEEAEGKAFFCDGGDIVIICKYFPHYTLEEVGRHIADLYLAKHSAYVQTSIYNLFLEGAAFIQAFHSRIVEIDGETLVAVNYDLDDNIWSKVKARLFAKLKDIETTNERRKLHVLLVDDDQLVHHAFIKFLGVECRMAAVETVRETMEYCSRHNPDVIFLDINLPDGDGREVLDVLMSQNPKAYIVMLSSNDGMDNIVDALDTGARGFVAKPFRKEHLVHYLNAHPAVQQATG